MSYLKEVAADHPCDRCGHASKHHAAPERGSGCQMVEAIGYSVYSKNAQVSGKAKQCWCDGFFPRP